MPGTMLTTCSMLIFFVASDTTNGTSICNALWQNAFELLAGIGVGMSGKTQLAKVSKIWGKRSEKVIDPLLGET